MLPSNHGASASVVPGLGQSRENFGGARTLFSLFFPKATASGFPTGTRPYDPRRVCEVPLLEFLARPSGNKLLELIRVRVRVKLILVLRDCILSTQTFYDLAKIDVFA